MSEETETFADVLPSAEQETEEAVRFVEANRIEAPSTQRLACVDEGYGREVTQEAPIRLAGGDPGAIGAIIATAQEKGISLPDQTELLTLYLGAKRQAFDTSEATLSYHTDGHAKFMADETTHHVDDMHCGHLAGLTSEEAASAYGFTDKGEYMRGLLDAVVTADEIPGVNMEKIRLRQDQSSHDAKGALLVYGQASSVHSRSADGKESYFVVDMDRTKDFFTQVVPHLGLGLEPGEVFDAYSRQANVTLARVSTTPGKMPVFEVAVSSGSAPQISLAGRV